MTYYKLYIPSESPSDDLGFHLKKDPASHDDTEENMESFYIAFEKYSAHLELISKDLLVISKYMSILEKEFLGSILGPKTILFDIDNNDMVIKLNKELKVCFIEEDLNVATN